MFVYRIQDKNTKLFSTGSSRPTWNKKGKIFTQLNHARSHVTYIAKQRNIDIYKDAEIVEYSLTIYDYLHL